MTEFYYIKTDCNKKWTYIQKEIVSVYLKMQVLNDKFCWSVHNSTNSIFYCFINTYQLTPFISIV